MVYQKAYKTACQKRLLLFILNVNDDEEVSSCLEYSFCGFSQEAFQNDEQLLHYCYHPHQT